MILYLGNISFGALDDKDRAAIFGKAALSHVATLLGLDTDALRKMLTHTVNVVRGEEMLRPLKPSQAEDIRDGAAKVRGGLPFNWGGVDGDGSMRRVGVQLGMMPMITMMPMMPMTLMM